MKRAKSEAQTATEASQNTQTASKWSRQLPSRLLVVFLEMSQSRDVVAAITACKSWKQTQNLDLVWRRLYLRDWEAETAEDKAIAVKGKDTSWSLRYKRRLQGERNFQSGKARVAQLTVPFAYSACQHRQYLALASIKGELALVDTQNGNSILQQNNFKSYSGVARTVITDGSLIYIGELDPKGIVSYSVPDLKEGRTFAYPDNTTNPEFCMIRANGKQVVAAVYGQEYRVLVWDVATGELKLAFKPERWLVSMQVDWETGLLYGLTGAEIHTYSLSSAGKLLSSVKLNAVGELLAYDPTSRCLFVEGATDRFRLTVPTGILQQQGQQQQQQKQVGEEGESKNNQVAFAPVIAEHTSMTRASLDGFVVNSRHIVRLHLESGSLLSITPRLSNLVSSTSSTKSESTTTTTATTAKISLPNESWNPLLTSLRIYVQSAVPSQKETAFFMLDFTPE